MSVSASTLGGVQRRVFRNLMVMWGLFMLAALVLLALTVPFAKAHAAEVLPVPKLMRETTEPEFVTFTSVPSQGLKADRCQSYLNDPRSNPASVALNQRPAGQDQARSTSQKINAIKAYRNCKSQSALQQLAVWRWSR